MTKNMARKPISNERQQGGEEKGSRQLQAIEIHLLYQSHMILPREYPSLAIVATACLVCRQELCSRCCFRFTDDATFLTSDLLYHFCQGLFQGLALLLKCGGIEGYEEVLTE